MEVETKSGGLLRVEFECCTVPRYNITANKDWVSWGVDNAYPNFLLFLHNRNAYHGMILQAKSEYIYGKGLTYDKDELSIFEQAQYDQFLSKANDSEGWNDIFKKNCKPGEIFNGICLQVVWKVNGKPDVFAMNPGLFRTNTKATKYYYCEAWNKYNSEGVLCENPSPEKHESFRVFDAFNPKIRTGAQILFYKAPFLTLEEYGHLYPEPNYIQVIQDVETDIEITNFHYNGLKNGMSASSIVTLFNGEPEPAEKKKIAAKFKNKHTGSNNAGGVVINFTDKGGQAADIKNLTMSDLDKMFEVLGKRLQQNIFSGHRFDPILGGIMQEGQLGGAREILEKWDKFLKTYIQHRQEMHLSIIRLFGDISGVDLSKLEVKQLTPIREELPVDQNTIAILGNDVIKKYLAKRYDIDIEESDAEVAKMEALPVNENIKNLKGAEYRRLQNMIAKYKAGKITRQEVEHFIKGFGLGQDYIDIALGKENFSKAKCIEDLFEAYAIDDNPEDEVISEEFIRTKVEGLEAEFNGLKKAQFADLERQVLEALKGNPSMTEEELAKRFDSDLDTIKNIFEALTVAGLITATTAGIVLSEKALATRNINIEYETYTVYDYILDPNKSYAGNPNQISKDLLSTSHDFCKRLIRLSNAGKRWTKEALDRITNEFGEDAWTYRGGFTGQGNGVITPYCNHIFRALTKVRRKS